MTNHRLYNLTELRNLKLNNFVRWYVGRDSFGARVAPKIEKNSATNGKSCIWDINDAKPSGSDFNFEFDLDELDQIGNGYYSSNPTGVTPYYVLIRLVDSNGNMSNPTIFKITTNGSRDEKTWSVSKIS